MGKRFPDRMRDNTWWEIAASAWVTTIMAVGINGLLANLDCTFVSEN
jgi:hypothetical protein